MFLVICTAHGDKTISDGSAAFYPAYTDPANIVIVVYGRYQNLQRSLLFAAGAGTWSMMVSKTAFMFGSI